ncbi:hypothetical protein B9Z55_026487 [Caenorhabditis nigoni]|uniref:Uncharacterized protein n=1 Tax=Caenorhabditis nigoni TaxID=1611254 RepID=A0A2G5T311_9PELO|nr:hypothetical protein B9Z55_026487 [Caenorhabditis nigoni]
MLVPHIWPKLPLFHPQWLSLWTTYSNVMQTTTVDELIEALARSPPIPNPSPIVKLLQASASSTHTSAALPSVVQLLQASASSLPTSAALPSNSQPKPFDIENLLSQ